MIDLDPKFLEMVDRILALHVPDMEVRAFGSRVRENAGKFSDLDLALVADGAIPLSRLENLKDAFSVSDLPIAVDVLDWNSVADSFRRVIAKDYVVLRPADGSARHPSPSSSSAMTA